MWISPGISLAKVTVTHDNDSGGMIINFTVYHWGNCYCTLSCRGLARVAVIFTRWYFDENVPSVNNERAMLISLLARHFSVKIIRSFKNFIFLKIKRKFIQLNEWKHDLHYILSHRNCETHNTYTYTLIPSLFIATVPPAQQPPEENSPASRPPKCSTHPSDQPTYLFGALVPHLHPEFNAPLSLYLSVRKRTSRNYAAAVVGRKDARGSQLASEQPWSSSQRPKGLRPWDWFSRVCVHVRAGSIAVLLSMCAPSHVGGSLIICEGGGGGKDARKMKCGRFFVVIGFEDFMFKVMWNTDVIFKQV